MKSASETIQALLGDVGIVFRVSAAIIVLFVAAAAVAPGAVGGAAQAVLQVTATNLGWMYLLVITVFVGFVLYLGLSKFGTIRLGAEDEPAEFSFSSWLAMIFSAGMGVGLVFWGVAEPIMHFNEPPMGSAPPTNGRCGANRDDLCLLSLGAASMGEFRSCRACHRLCAVPPSQLRSDQ